MLKNVRLSELVAIVKNNQPFFEEFINLLHKLGSQNLSEFVAEKSDSKARAVIQEYFKMTAGAKLYDGLNRPYPIPKARWYFLGWLLRDAPAQRLEPLLKDIPGKSLEERRAFLLNEIRKFVAPLLPGVEHWTWPVIFEILLARLEGSRRSLRGSLLEKFVRDCLRTIFKKQELNLEISEKQVRIKGETYDLQIKGRKNSLLMPIKTRETMGGGHAMLFTRDIAKSISVAKANGLICVPIIIAESWSGRLESLEAENFVYIKANPNEIGKIEPLLTKKLRKLLPLFKELT